jgi:hypothetical protein
MPMGQKLSMPLDALSPALLHQLWRAGVIRYDAGNPWSVARRTTLELHHVLIMIYGKPFWPRKRSKSARVWMP